MAIIKTIDLNKTYKGGGGVEVHAVEDVNLEIDAGALVSIMGPSGSGKSTLLNLLGLLDKPSSGEIKMDGREVCCLSSGERTKIRREQIGFVFQSFNLIPTLTSIENVMLPLRYSGSHNRKQLAKESLERVGLGHRINFRSNELSGGEMQRVAIARALVLNPAIVLADEPTGELDSKSSESIVELLKELNQSQKQTIILVTHDSSVAAHTDHTFNMVDGKILNGLPG